MIKVPICVEMCLASLEGALTYAELGTMMPESGGEYLYIRRGFGGLVGYLYAFMNVTIIKPREGRRSRELESQCA